MGVMNIFKKNKSEFHLENVIEMNTEFPRKFLIPSEEEIENLEIGNIVKLIFVMESSQKDGCSAERMWVKIATKQNGIFTGVLDNEPYYIKSIKAGDIINFKAENIASIYGGEAPFDESLFAIITQKALDKRQVNWVVRTDDLDHDRDSGWQLFYGDESDEYLEDSNNAKIISLEQVLSFEPLLENVFSEQGYAYEYSEQKNKFIEVKE